MMRKYNRRISTRGSIILH